jgi:hypothetical protein
MVKRIVEKKTYAKKKIKSEETKEKPVVKSTLTKLPKPTEDFGNYVLVAKRDGKILVMWGGFAKREDARELRELAIMLRENKNTGPFNLAGCDFTIAQGKDHVAGSTVNYQPTLSKRQLRAPINLSDSVQIESTIDLAKNDY